LNNFQQSSNLLCVHPEWPRLNIYENMNLGTLSPIVSTRKSTKPWKRSTIERQVCRSCSLQVTVSQTHSTCSICHSTFILTYSQLSQFSSTKTDHRSETSQSMSAALAAFQRDACIILDVCSTLMSPDWLSIQFVSSLYPRYDRGSWSTSIHLDCLRCFLT